MELNGQQKQQFVDQGYVVVPGVVPPVMVDAAVRAVNHSLGEGMDPADVPVLRSRSYCPELQSEPVIRDLFRATPAQALAESLGGGAVYNPVGGGQIALRFPRLGDPPVPLSPHIDGMHSPLNGVPAGSISSFTMLASIALSPVRQPWAGNFTVWPGTHRLYQDYFREHGPEALLDGLPEIELPAPVMVQAEPGDLVLVHYLLAHTAAPNFAVHTRYAIFFRLKHTDHVGWRKETFTDIWLEYAGLRGLVPGATGERPCS